MSEIHTDFLPAERESQDTLKKQSEIIKDYKRCDVLINAIPIFYLVLNDKRQIVFANDSVLNSQELSDKNILGLRPGELFNCIHSDETEGGCGTTLFCRYCGAAKSISLGIAGTKNMEECRIIQKNGNSLNLEVYSTPLVIDGQHFNIFNILDISDRKRKLVLERIFYHDILNLAGSLKGWLSLLEDADSNDLEEIYNTLHYLSNNIIDEIRSQKLILEAENNKLSVNKNEIHSIDLLNSIALYYKHNEIISDKTILIDSKSQKISFKSDLVLIQRVLTNLLKNALEASEKNSVVTIGCLKKNNSIEFWVHNSTFMNEEIQKQLFLHSFSTKGIGRGLGTYSVKLLTEKYLNGKVSFVSSKAEGTTFMINLPLDNNE